MNKVCGYNCEHNKSGICQITGCIKKSYVTNMTTGNKRDNYKQALIDIREFINKFHTLQRSTYENQHILQIIDKVLGDDK